MQSRKILGLRYASVSESEWILTFTASPSITAQFSESLARPSYLQQEGPHVKAVQRELHVGVHLIPQEGRPVESFKMETQNLKQNHAKSKTRRHLKSTVKPHEGHSLKTTYL